ncbi:hypothetical protein [Mailhella massiliensis]|uniref:DUF4292 domain-containing protein n=1 Tax=Mailhella massiliensis TaxID=1903261 RepID=A0A921AUT7_9BACT|nr:hypothetical protein [Mailhella massiliensis]HJD96202.1 hypothetical protein [Mailhella massiliensis]
MKKIPSLLLVCLILLALLGGCAPRGQLLVPESEAESRWQAFMQLSSRPAEDDMLSGSLRFGPEGDTRRVTYVLWTRSEVDLSAEKDGHGPAGLDTADFGSDMPGDARAIRLEVNAGVGANVAKALFDNGRMLVVLPRDQKAYAGVETAENLRRLLGLPLPFSMNRLNDFLAGRYLSALDVTAPERYLSGDDGNIIYLCRSEGRACELELNAEARPVRWSMSGRWTLDIAYGDDALPYKLDGRMEGEQPLRMVLLVKERRSAGTLPGLSMELEVPQDIAVYSLDQ